MGRRESKTKGTMGRSQKNKGKLSSQLYDGQSTVAGDEAEMNIQKPSASSFSKTRTISKIEDGQQEKKLKVDSKLDTENQIEVEEECFMDKLPPEMLMKILQYLDVKNVLALRLVNRKWNGIARDILKSRDDLESVFHCGENRRTGNTQIVGGKKQTGFQMFIKCFDKSKDSPLITRFHFNDIKPSVFDYQYWIKFISNFGESMKSLRLIIKNRLSEKDLIELTGKLRSLLLNQLPNLQEFGLQFSYSATVYISNSRTTITAIPPLPQIQLFPSTKTTEFQLPNLKILHLDEYFFSDSHYKGIVTGLLRAAFNLQKIEPFQDYDSHTEVDSLHLLQSFGKLHCLKDCGIILTKDFLSQINKKGSILNVASFKLKKLRLRVSAIYKNEALWTSASEFLSNLFESSKDSLTELEMEPLEFLPGLQLPKFSKLTKLRIVKLENIYRTFIMTLVLAPFVKSIKVLSSKQNLKDIFPVLKHLELEMPWTDIFHWDETLFCFPNLDTLVITGEEMEEEDIAQISKACPNLKDFRIRNDFESSPLENFPEVGRAIWTHLKNLQTLKLVIDTSSPENNFPAIDSCITGISEQDCIRLFDLIKDDKVLKNEVVSPVPLNEMKKNPSISDLKDLKNLTICLVSNNWNAEEDSTSEMSKKMLVVSKNYAFKLMDGLKYKIEKRWVN